MLSLNVQWVMVATEESRSVKTAPASMAPFAQLFSKLQLVKVTSEFWDLMKPFKVWKFLTATDDMAIEALALSATTPKTCAVAALKGA